MRGLTKVERRNGTLKESPKSTAAGDDKNMKSGMATGYRFVRKDNIQKSLKWRRTKKWQPSIYP